jgi:hypothetical protein
MLMYFFVVEDTFTALKNRYITRFKSKNILAFLKSLNQTN